MNSDSKTEVGSADLEDQKEVIDINSEYTVGEKVLFDDNGNEIYEQTDAERELVRKLDYIYVMPFIAILNFLQVTPIPAFVCNLFRLV